MRDVLQQPAADETMFARHVYLTWAEDDTGTTITGNYHTRDVFDGSTVPYDPVPAAEDVRTILLVRANFRIGNTVLATAVVPVLRARFPHAEIDFLGGDTTVPLLGGQGLRRIHAVSRSFVRAPWRFVALFLRLRREHYDVALDAGMSGISGPLYTWLSHARHRIGAEGRARLFLTTRVALPKRLNVYERAHALGLVHDGNVEPFLAVCAGGHVHKRWPQRDWIELVQRLGAESVPVALFVGPDELALGERLREVGGPTVRIVPPKPLHVFAGMRARATLFLTPDSDPMHVAAALRVPVAAIIRSKRSLLFAPRGSLDSVLRSPNPVHVIEALRCHPTWDRIRGPQTTVAPPSTAST